jgi:hypothetical protein
MDKSNAGSMLNPTQLVWRSGRAKLINKPITHNIGKPIVASRVPLLTNAEKHAIKIHAVAAAPFQPWVFQALPRPDNISTSQSTAPGNPA